jgi:hypothetical protein
MSYRSSLEVLAFGVVCLWLVALLPAGVVAILKDRLLLFLAGWLTLGFTWFVAAIPLADPNSFWARRFYGEERLARARDPLRHPRPRRVALAWVGGTFALLLMIGFLAARPAPILGLEGKALQDSVGGLVAGPAKPCRPRGGAVWICAAYDREVSSMVPYWVKVGGLGCWTAVAQFPAHLREPLRRSGCVTVWNYLQPI